MEKTDIKQLFTDWKSLVNNNLTINGWVRTVRTSKDFGFIELNDGTTFKNIQIVFKNNLTNFEEISKLSIGSSLEISGILLATPEAKQAFEIQAENIIIINQAAADFPLQKKGTSLEFLRTIAHLRPRTNTFKAVFRVRSLAAFAIHKFFAEQDFINVHTPVITGSDCEGAGEMFRITTLNLENIPKTEAGVADLTKDYFGKTAGLTVSGQLEAECFALAFKKVYTFGPTFRAENSNTTRHLSEFWMIEPEIAFADLNDDIKLAENMIKYVVNYVIENAPDEIAFFDKLIKPGLVDRLNVLANEPFARITYTEAIDILQKSGQKFVYEPIWGPELQTEHERYLAEFVFKKPVFVTDYPKEAKAFYMRLNDDGKTVAATDLLAPGIGEIIGGSQREERFELLEARIKELGFKPEDYWWYTDLRRYGSVPHAGFGLGFERLIVYITGMDNVRDVSPFPRTPKNLEF